MQWVAPEGGAALLEPILELMLDAVDMSMTIVLLLALWDGRNPDFRRRAIEWLTGREAAPDPVQQFLAAARDARAGALGTRTATTLALGSPPADEPHGVGAHRRLE